MLTAAQMIELIVANPLACLHMYHGSSFVIYWRTLRYSLSDGEQQQEHTKAPVIRQYIPYSPNLSFPGRMELLTYSHYSQYQHHLRQLWRQGRAPGSSNDPAVKTFSSDHLVPNSTLLWGHSHKSSFLIQILVNLPGFL